MTSPEFFAIQQEIDECNERLTQLYHDRNELIKNSPLPFPSAYWRVTYNNGEIYYIHVINFELANNGGLNCILASLFDSTTGRYVPKTTIFRSDLEKVEYITKEECVKECLKTFKKIINE